MKTNLIKLFLLQVIFVVAGHLSVSGQQVIFKPFAVTPSTLLEDIKAFKLSDPKISTEELVKKSNALLQTKGLNYPFALDAGVCQKANELKVKQKTPNTPLNLNAKLDSFEGDTANIILPPLIFGKDDKCFSSLPLIEITQSDFVTFVRDRTVKFYKPRNFNFNEAVLVDNKTLKTPIRNWKVPFCLTPLSVSEDGKLLYLNFPANELSEMILIAYDEGTIQFYAKKDVDFDVKTALPESLTKLVNSTNDNFTVYGTGEKQRVLKFSNVCE